LRKSIFSVLVLAFIWLLPLTANAMATIPDGDGHKVCMASCDKTDMTVDATTVSGAKLAAYAIGDDVALESKPTLNIVAYGGEGDGSEEVTARGSSFDKSDMRLNL
jgi:hypothetical protein